MGYKKTHSKKQNILGILIMSILVLGFLSAKAKTPILTYKEISSPPPRIIRTCCSFGIDLSMAAIPLVKRTDITCIENLGTHKYLGNKDEGNGIIYTKRGGFIDLGHLRDCADWTAYLYNIILLKKEYGAKTLTELGTEGGPKTLILKIPLEIDSMEVYQVAGKIAYELSLWHEIATWFGVSYIPFIPERYSSFSPEDLYSNLLGVEIGIKALKSDLEYDEAMTLLIRNMLDSLETVTTLNETYRAMEEVENIWWTREKSLPNKKILLERYVDSDDYLIPWFVSNQQSIRPPYKINKPEKYLSYLYELKIKINHKIPLKSILSSNKDRIITQEDFNAFMVYIGNDIADLNQKMAKQAERKKKRKDKKLQS